MRNAVKRKTHKERSQPSSRAKFGLLEKHKVTDAIGRTTATGGNFRAQDERSSRLRELGVQWDDAWVQLRAPSEAACGWSFPAVKAAPCRAISLLNSPWGRWAPALQGWASTGRMENGVALAQDHRTRSIYTLNIAAYTTEPWLISFRHER